MCGREGRKKGVRKEGIEGGRRGAEEVVRGKEGRRRRDGGRERSVNVSTFALWKRGAV